MADVVLGNPELYFITGAVRVGVPAPWGCEKYCVNGSLAGNYCLAWGNDDCRNGTLARRSDGQSGADLANPGFVSQIGL